MLRLLITFLLALPMTLSAQIYKTTDEHGNVVYTDAPPSTSNSSEKVQLNRTNTSSPPPEVVRPAPPAPQEEPEETRYSAEITSPPNETTIAMGPGNFTVSAKVRPSLAAGESLQLLIDGAPRGEPQTEPLWNLTNVFRGQHDLTVMVLDADGQPLATSEPVRVYVFRPSTNFKNRN